VKGEKGIADKAKGKRQNAEAGTCYDNFARRISYFFILPFYFAFLST
jgi:hypothetical protein